MVPSSRGHRLERSCRSLRSLQRQTRDDIETLQACFGDSSVEWSTSTAVEASGASASISSFEQRRILCLTQHGSRWRYSDKEGCWQ